MGRATYEGLLGRGFTNELALRLTESGETLKSLKLRTEIALHALGLTAENIQALKRDDRPPIPPDVLTRVLTKAAYTCCICKDRSAPVVVHHIDPWAESRSHAEDNLVVLSLNNHARAHRIGELEQNLTRPRLRQAKTEWEAQVAATAARSLLAQATAPTIAIDYYNHRRLFELANNLSIDPRVSRFFGALSAEGIVDEHGFLGRLTDPRHAADTYVYSMKAGIQLNAYMQELLVRVCQRFPIADLTQRWNRTDIRSLATEGSLIHLEAGFTFKRIAKTRRGPHQTRSARYNALGIELEFTFDAFECTSMSSWGHHLSRKRRSAVFALVRSIDQVGPRLRVSVSALAISSPHSDYTTREHWLDRRV